MQQQPHLLLNFNNQNANTYWIMEWISRAPRVEAGRSDVYRKKEQKFSSNYYEASSPCAMYSRSPKKCVFVPMNGDIDIPMKTHLPVSAILRDLKDLDMVHVVEAKWAPGRQGTGG